MNQPVNTDCPSVSGSGVLITTTSVSRPAFSWCSKCGQSVGISTESNLYKSKNNFKFRKMFDFEESEVLVKTFSCALVDEILFQGTLYASQNFFCFFSRIANKQKKVVMSIEKIIEITKEKTAGIFPNAIAIRTEHNRHLFASFVHREMAFRCLNEVWTNHQNEKFSTNWSLDGNYSKGTQILDIDVETDSLIIQTPMIPIQSSKDNLIVEDEEEDSYQSVDLIRPPCGSNKSSQLSNQSLDQSTLDSSEVELENISIGRTSFFKIILNSISKEKIQLVTAISILIFLTLYIVILAWKIHDFQVILIDRFSASCHPIKANIKNVECPVFDRSCTIQKESIINHQNKMSKVLSNLKDTLNLLQNVVEISGQMFSKVRPASLSSIIGSSNKNNNDG